MQESFDPYWQWLGIPPSEQPPNHYRLLGLLPYEHDRAMIGRALEERTALIRAKAGGPNPAAVEDLLGDLATARHLLLNPTFKQQYDLMLRGQLQSASEPARPAPVGPSPAATAPRIVTEAADAASRGGATAPANGGQASGQSNSIALHPGVIAGVAGGVVLIGLLVAMVVDGGSEDRGAPRDRSVSASRRSGGSKPSTAPRSSSGRSNDRSNSREPTSSWRNGSAPPLGSRTFADLMAQADDSPPDTSTTTGLLAAARIAMADRQLEAARHHVEAAATMAKSPTERDEVQRVQKLLVALEGFWEAVRKGAGGLQSGEEIAVGSTRVAVIQADRDRLMLRVAGENRTYTVGDGLPTKLAVTLAERKLSAGSPTANARIGAFLAIDAKGDRDEARRRLEQGGAEGRAVLPELKMARPVKSAESDRLAPPPAGNSGGSLEPRFDGGPAGATAARLPVPDAVTLAGAEAEVRQTFRDAFSAARDKPGKVALAKTLFDTAEQTRDAPGLRYAMYEMARDLAVELGDPQSFCWAIDRMGSCFQIDAIGMKAEGLAKAWREQTEVGPRAAIYRYSSQLLDEAMRAKNYQAADRVIRIAISGAKAGKDFALVRQLEEKARDIRAAL